MKFKKFLETKPDVQQEFFIGKARDMHILAPKKKLKDFVPFIGKKRDIDKLDEKFNPDLLKVVHAHENPHDYSTLTSKLRTEISTARQNGTHHDFSHIYDLEEQPAFHLHPELDHLKTIANITHPKALAMYTGQSSGTLNRALLAQHGAIKGQLALKTPKELANAQDMKKLSKKYYPKGSAYDTVKNPEKYTPPHRSKLDASMSEMIKNNKTSHELHVYSGLGFSPEHHIHKPSFKLPAYTSTTLRQGLAKQWASDHSTTTNNSFNSSHIYKTKLNPDATETHTQVSRLAYSKRDPLDYSSTHGRVYGHVVHIHIPEDAHALYTHGVDKHYKSAYPTEQEVILHKGAKLHINREPTVDHKSKTVMWHAKLVHDGVKPTKFGDLT